jgi:hypothetical protein
MIKLNAMRLSILFAVFLLLTVIIRPGIGSAQSIPDDPQIIAPRGGEAVQGSVEISGITEVSGFSRVEVEYRYTNDPKNTWFLITESDKSVNPGRIAQWETSTISDGNYDLRVTVFTVDEKIKPVTISGLRVRNYSPVESPTPIPLGEESSTKLTITPPIPTRTPHPTMVSLPKNPAVFTNSDLNYSVFRGAAAGVGFFIVFAIYLVVKKSLI